MTLLDTKCCLGYPDAQPCDKPVTWYALSAYSPDLWSDSAGASLGGFCSREHADAEPRPSLDNAKRVYGMVVEGMGCNCGHCELDGVGEVWRRLLDVFPDPVPVDGDASQDTAHKGTT